MMKTNAKQLIEFLQKLPPDTEIKVLQEKTLGYETTTDFVGLELPAGNPLIDCTDTCDVLTIAKASPILYLGQN